MRHALALSLVLLAGCASPRVVLDPANISVEMPADDVAAGDDLYPISVAGRWGYMDRQGQVVLAPRFQAAADFSEGRAAVRDGGLWGYIRPDGDWVARPQYDHASPYASGRALVAVGEGRNRRYGFLGPQGAVAVALTLPMALDYSEGLAMVQLREPETAPILRFLSRVFPNVGQADLVFITTSGELAFEVPGSWGASFSDGKAPFEQRYGFFGRSRWGYIDRTGRVVVPADLDGPAFRYSDGLARVARDGRIGFVDESGVFVIEPVYALAFDFADGLAPVQVDDGRWGFIDRTGALAIPPQFSAALPFSGGRAAVQTEAGWGYVSTDGTMAVEPGYSRASSFRNGLAWVYRGDALSYIDVDGTAVWPR